MNTPPVEVMLNLDSRGLEPGSAKLAVRPNRIFIDSRNTANAAVLPGVVEKATYVGDRIEYKIGTEQGVLFCTSETTDRQVAELTEVAVSFDVTGPVLLPENT